VELIDLGSVNGTWLNDERLRANIPYPLESGELIGLGKLRLQVFWREASR
jgi:pSer/pThr/pTyr-binding forkhead associated (FHA) protein